MKELDNIGVDNLSRAIIVQTARDYLQLKTAIRNNPDDKNVESWKSGLVAIKRFFNSEYYQMLTKVSPDYLIRKLDEAFEEGKTTIEYITV